MKVPYLKAFDNCYVSVTITDGITVNGAPKVVAEYVGKCNFDEKATTTVTSDGADGVRLRLNGKVTIKGDIAPDVRVIQGAVSIDGKGHNIHVCRRIRNLDGSVHHTVLELI